MKKLLIILLIYGCDDLKRAPVFDFSNANLIEQDSILKLADEALVQMELNEKSRQDLIVQIGDQLKNKELNNQQIQQLEQQKEEFVEQLVEANKRKLTEKDSIVYSIQYRDTQLYHKVYVRVYDTVHVEVLVLDTVRGKKPRKRKNNGQTQNRG